MGSQALQASGLLPCSLALVRACGACKGDTLRCTCATAAEGNAASAGVVATGVYEVERRAGADIVGQDQPPEPSAGLTACPVRAAHA